jgi:O-acetylhomoserine (thiol)-lyase
LPIYQTTSYVFDSADHAASLFNLQTFGNVYSRLSNPTVAVLEERIAALEGGRAAVAAASGMAAEMLALLTILQTGDHVVAAGALYGGSVTMLAVNFAKLGIEVTFVVSQCGEQCRDLEHAEIPALFVDTADVSLQRLVLPVDDCAASGRASLKGRVDRALQRPAGGLQSA